MWSLLEIVHQRETIEMNWNSWLDCLFKWFGIDEIIFWTILLKPSLGIELDLKRNSFEQFEQIWSNNRWNSFVCDEYFHVREIIENVHLSCHWKWSDHFISCFDNKSRNWNKDLWEQTNICVIVDLLFNWKIFSQMENIFEQSSCSDRCSIMWSTIQWLFQ